MNYKDLLDRSYKMEKEDGPSAGDDYSVGEYLADHIFEFTTYAGGISEYLSAVAVDVCEAITNRSTFQFISDDDRHIWFITMCNMPFFEGKINWGTSIRGAWWDISDITIDSCGLYNEHGEQITELTLNKDEWLSFISAVIDFYRDHQQ